MSIDRPITAGLKITRAKRAPQPEPAPETNNGRLRNAPEPPPLDWEVAMHAAAALLDESFGAPGSLGNPLMADMVQELAARLCACGEIEATVDHMHTGLDEPLLKK